MILLKIIARDAVSLKSDFTTNHFSPFGSQTGVDFDPSISRMTE